jgi:hypothetical protein
LALRSAQTVYELEDRGWIPLACAMVGWSVTDAAAGQRFGVPEFVPWPVNTILGFCLAVAFVTAVLKVGLTVAIVRGLAVRRRGRSAVSV